MIQLEGITKDYISGDLSVRALKGIDLVFRENEFVSILGPSGGGKTTLLNIIGGLDQYTEGDLIINRKSTRNFSSRDWDAYRNHSVGFVFQSYNLIAHQNVLSNVEIALTISGVSKQKRRALAIQALEKVGLGDQLKKKPNQLSGGQMQRVAIARALVNDPDILLADEPTGALDSETSTTVMELLKEVAKDRLVVMVTHNPTLAQKYSTRIINIMDGAIIGDSNPFTPPSPEVLDKQKSKIKKPNMNFLTALSLSLNNLMTKRGRTILTAFAGSIGITGIALILSLSSGVNDYIATVQEDTLSSYPLTLESASADLTGMMSAMMGTLESNDKTEGVINEVKIVTDMFAQVGTNDLKSFKSYLEQNSAAIAPHVNAIKYSYGITPQIYSSDTSVETTVLNPSQMVSSFTNSMNSAYMSSSFFQEMIDNKELLTAQYDVVAGAWPQKYDEVVLVLNDRYNISDFLVYALGLRDQDKFSDMIKDVMNGDSVVEDSASKSFTYDDFLNMTFKLVLPGEYYRYNKKYDVWEDMQDDEDYMKELVDNGEDIKIVGIICPKPGAVASSLSIGIAYTSDLTKHIISASSSLPIVSAQLEDKETDVFSGKTFEQIEDGDDSSGLSFNDMIKIDSSKLKKAFGMNIDQAQLESMMQTSIIAMTESLSTDTTKAEKAFSDVVKKLFTGAIALNSSGGLTTLTMQNAASMMESYIDSPVGQSLIAPLSTEYGIPITAFSSSLKSLCASVAVSAVNEGGGTISLNEQSASDLIDASLLTPIMGAGIKAMGKAMTEAAMKIAVSSKAGEMAMNIITAMAGGMKVDTALFASAFDFSLDEDELSRLISTMMTSSGNEKSQKGNLAKLGYADLADPSMISIYLTDFDSKQTFKDMIKAYNEKAESENDTDKKITYTDLTGILMSSVTSIVDTVSYVLVAFVSVSLVVSSIMIGIITYISVLERTKEIGILRAVGASKRDISRVFNAETFIIGLISGLIGIASTMALCIPINIILRKVTGIASIGAFLPYGAGAVLVVISVVLTLIAGIVPSRIAAKKDPVIALRSE